MSAQFRSQFITAELTSEVKCIINDCWTDFWGLPSDDMIINGDEALALYYKFV